MADIVSPQKRSEMMSGIKGKNTKPEIALRKALHQKGFRFRIHNKDLPGKPDIVLPKFKTVIFVHGCFWHGHNSCRLFRLPKSRKDFWEQKIRSNIERDQIKTDQLVAAGWKVLIVWECLLKGNVSLLEKLIFVLERLIHSEVAGIVNVRESPTMRNEIVVE